MKCLYEKRPLLQAIDLPSETVYLYLTRCKRWDCPACGTVNKLQWIAKISQGIDTYQEQGIRDWMFCTITSHPSLKNRDQCLWVEPKAWKKLWSRIKYHYGKIRYIYIPEPHKNGRVHWHLIISGGIPIWWWKKHAPKCGFGYMADSQPVKDGQNSVLYVSKELSKGLHKNYWPKGLRRIRTNHHWPELESKDGFLGVELAWYYIGSTDSEEVELLRDEINQGTNMKVVLLEEN